MEGRMKMEKKKEGDKTRQREKNLYHSANGVIMIM